MQDPDARMTAVPGTKPAGPNLPPPVDPQKDLVDLEWLAPAVVLADLLNNIGGYNGEFCYIYV
jgi:tyrosinase